MNRTIEERLESFLSKKSREGITFNATMAKYHLGTGGKRLRALIPSWVYASCGADAERAIPLGCALELIHNATLVHDDLQDGDGVRRGSPAVWKQWSAAQAINCGDAFFQLAIELVCEMKLDPAILVHVIRRLSRGTLRVIEGQAQEFLMKDEPFPGVLRYMSVAESKTAALVATAVVSAMESLQLNESALAAAEDAALQAGILFQLQDDLLDLYGEKQREQRGADIAEGKVSILIALFNDCASVEDRVSMKRILETPREGTSPEAIQQAIKLLEKNRIRQSALERIETVRSRVERHELRTQAPEIHRLLLDLSRLFLEPIRHLF